MSEDKPPPPDIELGDFSHLDQYEDDPSDGDDGSAALLGAEGGTRATERWDAAGWRQVSSIVLEVRACSDSFKGSMA